MGSMDIANPSEEHTMLREMVRAWTEEHVEPQAFEHDRDEKFNLELLRSMGELGLLGISAPEEYGGAGLDAVACTIVHEELSASDPGFALAYLAHSMLFVNNLAYNGTEEQKARILPKVCSGEWIGAMAMSEPDAGTDVLGLSTSAEQRDDGSWVLNGRKMWITNGCIDEDGTPADVVWVYARTGEDDRGRVQMSTFLLKPACPATAWVRRSTTKPGCVPQTRQNWCLTTASFQPKTSWVMLANQLHMMGNLELERLTLAAMALALDEAALDEMNRYATDRTAFGSAIRDFGQIQRYIGESWAKYRAMRAYIYDTANNLTIGTSGQRLDSDGVKLFATTAAKEIADAAMQVMGGYGYVGEYHVERFGEMPNFWKSAAARLNLIRRTSHVTCSKTVTPSTDDF